MLQYQTVILVCLFSSGTLSNSYTGNTKHGAPYARPICPPSYPDPTQLRCYTESIIACCGLSLPNDRPFCSYLTTLPRQLFRPEVRKSLGISTPTSKQVQMEILVEKREEFLAVGALPGTVKPRLTTTPLLWPPH